MEIVYDVEIKIHMAMMILQKHDPPNNSLPSNYTTTGSSDPSNTKSEVVKDEQDVQPTTTILHSPLRSGLPPLTECYAQYRNIIIEYLNMNLSCW